jgi:hypothetical protein
MVHKWKFTFVVTKVQYELNSSLYIYLNFRHSFVCNSSCHVVHVACGSCGPWSSTVMLDDWHSHSFKPSPVQWPGPCSFGLVQWHSCVRIPGLGDHGVISVWNIFERCPVLISARTQTTLTFFFYVSPICKGKSWMEIGHNGFLTDIMHQSSYHLTLYSLT